MNISAREYIQFLVGCPAINQDVEDYAKTLTGKQGQGLLFRWLKKIWIPPAHEIVLCLNPNMTKRKWLAFTISLARNLGAFSRFCGKPLEVSFVTGERIYGAKGEWLDNTRGNKFVLQLRYKE